MSRTETALRNEAHDHFDRVWRFGALTRDEAYVRLAQHMGMTAEQCHFSKMRTPELMKAMAFSKAVFTPMVIEKVIRNKREHRRGKMPRRRGRHGAVQRRAVIDQMRSHEMNMGEE